VLSIIPLAARNVCKIRAASRSRNLLRVAIGGIVFACAVEKGLGIRLTRQSQTLYVFSR
jgi:hypothetical protein